MDVVEVGDLFLLAGRSCEVETLGTTSPGAPLPFCCLILVEDGPVTAEFGAGQEAAGVPSVTLLPFLPALLKFCNRRASACTSTGEMYGPKMLACASRAILIAVSTSEDVPLTCLERLRRWRRSAFSCPVV